MPENINNQMLFYRLFLTEFADAFAAISKSKQFDVILYVLKNLNSNNQYIGTLKETAARSEVPYKTVQNTFNEMREKDIMRMKQNGVYMINPKLLVYGPLVAEARLIRQYSQLSREKSIQLCRKIDVDTDNTDV